MAFKYEGYAVFPGRQHYVVMIPEKFPHLFLEGVQSIDSNPNTEDTEYGQYGFTDPVITEKAFKNETGTIAINHYGYAQRVLRAMAGQDPDQSFLYDKSYNGKVDFWENVYNKKRDRVVHSRYWFDAVMSTSHSSTLDGVETYSMDFTAARCLEFDGKQVATETFTDTAKNQRSFTLMSPAIIDPAMNDIRAYDPGATPANGVTVGSLRHELCPIQYALRVWVDGIILKDPDAAMIVTQAVSIPPKNPGDPAATTLISTLFLKEPLEKNGQIVKVAWIAEGDAYVAQSGVTAAPIMVNALPDVSGTPSVWGNDITVYLSRSLSPSSLAALSPSDFTLTFDDGSNTYVMKLAATNGVDITESVTGNAFRLTFDPTTAVDANTGAPASSAVWGPGVPAILSYIGTNMVGDSDGLVSPSHTLNIAAYV